MKKFVNFFAEPLDVFQSFLTYPGLAVEDIVRKALSCAFRELLEQMWHLAFTIVQHEHVWHLKILLASRKCQGLCT